jgi:hypothetical protein
MNIIKSIALVVFTIAFIFFSKSVKHAYKAFLTN